MEQNNNSAASLYTPLQDLLAQNERITVHDVLSKFEHRSYGFAIFFLALVIVVPTGIIPGVAIVTSGVVFIIVIQYALGWGHFYLPRVVDDHELSRANVMRIATFLEKHHNKVEWIMGMKKTERLFRAPYKWLTSLIMLLVALSTIPLTFMVFVETIPGILMMLFGLALITNNGRLLVVTQLVSIAYLFSIVELVQYLISLI